MAGKELLLSLAFMSCLVCLTNSRPASHDLLAEHIKEQILTDIEKNPGTHIMPTKDLMKEICLAKPFNQTIYHDKCIPKVIENRFCYGQCNSLYIPEINRSGHMATCFTCQPSSSIHELVELDCVVDNRFRQKTVIVEKIISCECNQCK
uniref:CTCK domain-containing protein n=1 Tax=Clytia hemisphaerica TaxID=252671 RepID=A0A069DN48_9CNID|eukprot:TCONS_00073450-protein